MPARRSSAWWVIWALAAVLFVLHQDFWFWDDRTLVLGFLPVGLAYHVAYSVAAALLWFAAVRFAWPHHIEEWADGIESGPNPPSPRMKA